MGGRGRRALLVTLLVPLLVGAAGAAIAMLWRDELPDPVATHWSAGGTPDGFTSRAAMPALMFLGPLIGLASGGLVLALGRRLSAMRRTGAGVAVGTSVFVTALMVATLHAQRGVPDAADSGDVLIFLPLALGLGLLAGALAAVAVGGAEPGEGVATGPIPADAPRADLRRVRDWSGTVRPGRPLLAVIAALVAGAIVFVVLGIAQVIPQPVALTLALILGAVAALGASMSAFRVRVDERGLTARSLVGWPTFRVALDEVAEARATVVSPFTDFGGWGVRMGMDGRMGIVLRAGEALEVRRGDDTALVVTVDDAATGAGLLNALAELSRGHSTPP